MGLSTFFDIPASDYVDEKIKFIEHMNFLRSMTNEEYTLYKKFLEIKEIYLNDKGDLSVAETLKKRIWRPSDLSDKKKTIEEITNLKPRIRFVAPDKPDQMRDWYLLRVFIHSMEFDQNPGRFLRFIVQDETTGKYLGLASLGSDVLAITCRDNWIGWTEDMRIHQNKIRNSAIATTIVPTQPLGYNFLGGKLIASLLCMPEIGELWNHLYGDVLAGITTTSLYGAHSMYQRIPWWKEMGETTGTIMLKPADKYYDFWHHWLKKNAREKYLAKTEEGDNGPATGVKQKILVMIMKELKLKQTHYMHGFKRGVYYAPLYENTKDFLQGKCGASDLVPLKKLDNPYDSILDWWKEKAIRRYENLYEQNRLNGETLFYDGICPLTWEETKDKFLGDVGR